MLFKTYLQDFALMYRQMDGEKLIGAKLERQGNVKFTIFLRVRQCRRGLKNRGLAKLLGFDSPRCFGGGWTAVAARQEEEPKASFFADVLLVLHR